jgi:peptide/nickel transport system ATP-binding protein
MGGRLATIASSPPDLAALPAGSAFAKRCPLASAIWRQTVTEPALLATDQEACCHHSGATAATLLVPS